MKRKCVSTYGINFFLSLKYVNLGTEKASITENILSLKINNNIDDNTM